MIIYNLTSTFYLDHAIEDGTVESVDTYNTDIAPPDGATNPRFISGAWIDVSASDKADQETAEKIITQIRINALQYLVATDWYASRKAETDIAIPSDVLAKRMQARIDASE